jgi:molybdopterin-guanine dinucleotide biosynthesis protein A
VSLKGHSKHTKLEKPVGGAFHRNEVAFIGAPCDRIQSLIRSIALEISDLDIGYVDADHGSGSDLPLFQPDYVDKINHHQLQFQAKHIQYDFRQMFNGSDLVLINGNHFKGHRQVVLLNEKKRESLSKKLDRLTQVEFFISNGSTNVLYDFLLAHNPSFANLPLFKISDIAGIGKALRDIRLSAIPTINGLVLAGGKSVRMGQDKSLIDYHGLPQAEHMAQMLDKLCTKTFISKAKAESQAGTFEVIQDSFIGLGPYGGILSAMQKDPNRAWLTVATDIPLVSDEHLTDLVAHREPSKMATCYHNPGTDLPEPLLTIWEPRAYPRLLEFLSRGYSCPRKVLINSDITEIRTDSREFLSNANTKEEMQNIKDKIGA